MKAAQTGILWSQVQVLVGPPKSEKATDFGQWLFSFRRGLQQTQFVKNSSRIIFPIPYGLGDKNLDLHNRNCSYQLVREFGLIHPQFP